MKHLFCLLLSWSTLCHGETIKPDLERRFTLSSGYVETFFNSNESLVHFPLSVMQAYSKLFDVATSNINDHFGKRIAISILEMPLSYFLSFVLLVPFHEFGHARAYAALGGYYRYGTMLYGRHIKRIPNFWILSSLRLIGIPVGGIAYTEARYPISELAEPLKTFYGGDAGFDIIGSAAGLNNEMFLAKKMSHHIYKSNGHPTFFYHYALNKMMGFLYALSDEENNRRNRRVVGDPSGVLQAYRKKGYAITTRDLKLLSLLTLASGTTFALLRSYYDYIRHNDAIVRPAELFGFRIPDLNGYITSRGLSFEIDTDYRIFSFLTVGLSYEFVWKGTFAHEFSPRVRYNLASAIPSLNELWLSSDLVIGSGVGGSLSTTFSPFAVDEENFFSRFAYFADFHFYNGYSLYGERNIVSLTNQKTFASEISLGLHLRY